MRKLKSKLMSAWLPNKPWAFNAPSVGRKWFAQLLVQLNRGRALINDSNLTRTMKTFFP